MVRLFQILLIIFSLQINFSQDKELDLTSSVDSISIKVGQQFNYFIKAESEKIIDLVFPEKFNFSPFEIAEEFSIDTTFFKGKKALIKKFKLTNFDEGFYTIKPQQILFNNKIYFTDSIPIEVRTIKVDTVSKKFFDIKEIILNKEERIPLSKYLLSIVILFCGIGLVFLLYKKFKNHRYDKSDYKTPFENAIDQLVNLEKETLDTQNDFKLFYSKLTLIAKEYLENDIEISASESTTTQLIDKIYLLNNSKKINISDDIIESFKTVLNNADLVKFAKFTPQNKAASDDNKFLKSFIVNTKKSIPNNIEQEDEQKRIIELRFNEMIKKRKIKYSLLSIITLLITFLSLIIVLFGAPNFQSLLTFDSDEKILKQQWVSSVYTGLNLSLETPDALIRSQDSTINKLRFLSKNKNLEINLITKTIDENSDPINDLLDDFKQRNFINVITKREEYKTTEDDQGIKIFGSFDDNNLNKKRDYVTILFVVNQLSIKLEVIFERKNETLKTVSDRIINSLKFIK